MGYLYVLLGVILGATISSIIFAMRNRTIGTLRIDHSDPEKDRYRFDIPNLDILDRKRSICLSIDNKADLSQE